MIETEGARYFNDDGTEFFPDLLPTPDLCVSCVSNETSDPGEEVLCNLTKADEQDDDVFICFAYRPISPNVNRADVLRELCKQAGVAYSEVDEDDSGPVPF